MIETRKIVVWDVDPPSELVDPLQRLLGTPNPWPFDGTPHEVEICAARDSDGGGLPLSRPEVDLVILVLNRRALERTKRLLPPSGSAGSDVPVLAVIKDGSSQDVFSLLQSGAMDFVVPPFTPDEFLPRVWRLLRKPPFPTTPDATVPAPVNGTKRLLGRNPRFTAELAKLPLIASCDTTVLIQGETGTGKELFARAIHDAGTRAKNPFVPLNCAAVPVELAESELFGHERGAFTGAYSAQPGVMRQASGGTLFLDEVPSLPLLVQAKLLRFLQEKEYRPLGSRNVRRADVRVIAATNVDLASSVWRGTFRRDLYYRLNVLPVSLVPLRERRDDIPLLSGAFVERVSKRLGRPSCHLSACALEKLTRHDWPGNVRELEHVIERTLVFSPRRTLTAADILLPGVADTTAPRSFREAKAQTISLFEKSYIESLLATHEGNISRAAQVAGKNRRAFWELIRKHSIVANDFRPPADCPQSDIPVQP
jgi:two-component system, NtrC family, response regulator GlrR